MKSILLLLVSVVLACTAGAQTAKEYYDQGMAKAKEDKFAEARELLVKAIALDGNVALYWHVKGIVDHALELYEDAIIDLEKGRQLGYAAYKEYQLSAQSKKEIGDYDGALADINSSIELKPTEAGSYYERGSIYMATMKRDLAIADFEKAVSMGYTDAQKKLDKCRQADPAKCKAVVRLVKKSTDANYGFTETKPIKVGTGLESGPHNQWAYLHLLRDGKGKRVKYERLKSCCMYKTKDGETAFADIYEISYLDEKGQPQKKNMYISFYDHEEPKIPVGFDAFHK